MKILYFLLIIFLLSMTFSCSNYESNKQGLKTKGEDTINSNKEYNNFISRIHTSSDSVDWYKILGPTTLKKHLRDLESINWKKEYWEQWNSDEFNFPDLEVIDKENYMYLSVSVLPKDVDSYQFSIGAGIYNSISKDSDEVDRTIRIYGTETDNPEIVKEIVQLFFDRKPEELAEKIKKLYFLDQLEDLYQNL